MKKHFIFIILCTLLFSCNNKEKKTAPKVEFKRETEQILERYPNGVKKIEGELVNGERHGTWKFYYSNGFVWSEGKYWYGKRKGLSSIFYENGKIKIEGMYKNDIKVGKWKLYNEDGSLNRIVNMDEMLTTADSLKINELTP